MTLMNKASLARSYFENGYNCAQSVFASFKDEMGLDEKTALRLSSGFGGGVGGLRSVCGAFSGAVMVLGMLKGYDTPNHQEAKEKLYQLVQTAAKQMTKQFDTYICHDLLEKNNIAADKTPAKRDEDYYRARPCSRYVEACAQIVQELL